MAYGDGDTQWMRAGKGVIHEEMWNLDALAAHTEKRSPKPWQRIEIFQLWVNLPKKHKDYPPAVHLLRATNTPLLECSNGASVRVICGDVVADAGGPAGDAHGGEIQRAHNAENIAASPMNILQVVVPANEKLHLSFPGIIFRFALRNCSPQYKFHGCVSLLAQVAKLALHCVTYDGVPYYCRIQPFCSISHERSNRKRY